MAATDSEAADRRWMALALALAERGLGAVWPNPAVGCVLVRDGLVVGRGWTQPGGRPHAETEALRRAGAAARGATAYVSLEPCGHAGRTPPCARALVAAGVARCVYALEDPDPRVSGAGAARLREAGVEVVEGVRAAEAAELNRGFLLRVVENRPLVTWKVAGTVDGRIAAAGGDSKWITGEVARAHGHLLRARHDAVLVGARTARIDAPRLDCRLPGLAARSPVRVVLDSRLELPPGRPPLAGGGAWVVCRKHASDDPNFIDASKAIMVLEADKTTKVLPVAPDPAGGVSMAAALAALAGRGVTRLLVEGGGRVAASLLRAGLVDRIEWLRAPMLMGGDGLPAAAAFGVESVAGAPRFHRVGLRRLGADVLESYRAAR